MLWLSRSGYDIQVCDRLLVIYGICSVQGNALLRRQPSIFLREATITAWGIWQQELHSLGTNLNFSESMIDFMTRLPSRDAFSFSSALAILTTSYKSPFPFWLNSRSLVLALMLSWAILCDIHSTIPSKYLNTPHPLVCPFIIANTQHTQPSWISPSVSRIISRTTIQDFWTGLWTGHFFVSCLSR